jgi:beta-lactamase class A
VTVLLSGLGTRGWLGKTGVMPLNDSVAALLAERHGRFGVYARNLTTNEIVAINADDVMPAESSVKTAILVHYEHEVDAGRVDPEQRVALTSVRCDGSGVLRYLANGLALTLDDLAWLTIIVSDNVATAMLVDALGGPEMINRTARRLGSPTTRWLGSTTLERAAAGQLVSESSPRDLAELYTHLGERARRILFRQQFQGGLPLRLPHNPYAADIGVDMPVRVFNKTGLGFGRFVDSALIETATTAWVVAAMADDQDDFMGPPEATAMAAFGHIGAVLFDAWGTTPDS